MIDLYALTSPNVQKIFIALEELGLPYNTRLVDVWKGEHYTDEFTRINPNQKIPAIVDHDGPGGKPYTVIESGAILMYLAEKTGKFMPKDMAKKYDVIQWLMIQVASVGPAFGNFTHFNLFAPKPQDYSLSRYRSEMLRLYELLDKRLGQTKYLGGDEYSIADIATFPWTRQHEVRAPDGGFVGRIDLACVPLRLGVEAHSKRFHFGAGPGLDDQERDDALAAVGWDVRYVGWHAATRTPSSGRSAPKRSRSDRRTGICPSAQSIRARPSGASPASRMSGASAVTRFEPAPRGRSRGPVCRGRAWSRRLGKSA